MHRSNSEVTTVREGGKEWRRVRGRRGLGRRRGKVEGMVKKRVPPNYQQTMTLTLWASLSSLSRIHLSS